MFRIGWLIEGFIELALFIVLVWFISKGCNYIQEQGIKGIATEIWEGTGPDSTKAVENE